MQFVLLRAERDLAEMAEWLGHPRTAAEARERAAQLEAGSAQLWNDALGAYAARDLRTGAFSDGVSSASTLCFYAGAGGGEGEREATARRHAARLLAAWQARLAFVGSGAPCL